MHARCVGKRYLEGFLHCLLSTGHSVRLNYEVTSANVDFQLFVGLAFQDSQTHYLPSDTLSPAPYITQSSIGKVFCLCSLCLQLLAICSVISLGCIGRLTQPTHGYVDKKHPRLCIHRHISAFAHKYNNAYLIILSPFTLRHCESSDKSPQETVQTCFPLPPASRCFKLEAFTKPP